MNKATTISLLALLLFAFTNAHAGIKDTLSPSLPTFSVADQNAEIAEIDRILVNSYLNQKDNNVVPINLLLAFSICM